MLTLRGGRFSLWESFVSKVTVACVGSVLAVRGVVDVFVLAAVAASGVRVVILGLIFAAVVGLLLQVALGGASQAMGGELLEGKVEACGGVGLAAWSANKQRQRRCLVLIL
ncbi:hypothetical protein [Actinomyces ruminicola]|uniref:hypothetical protein n=1 Tax=Actinomyces ruminicola TaxID=332524 RepID=UPI00210A8108|nr:hypothetical protein [Actinomyces ruminicola]